MNCHEFEAIVVDLVRGEGVGSEMGTRCWAHAANCPQCAERLLQQEKLTAGLAILAAKTEQPSPKNEFEDVLRREFRREFANPEGKRERKVLTIETPYHGVRFNSLWAWGVVAAAVLLASVAGILAVRSRPTTGLVQNAQNKPATQTRNTRQPNLTENAATQRATPESAKSPRVSASKKSHVDGKKNNSAPTSHPASRLNPNDEVATSFYPLPYGSGLGLDEGWQIVRVSLRPDALASLGLALPILPTGTIKADLVLGEDGMARAIRFVE